VFDEACARRLYGSSVDETYDRSLPGDGRSSSRLETWAATPCQVPAGKPNDSRGTSHL